MRPQSIVLFTLLVACGGVVSEASNAEAPTKNTVTGATGFEPAREWLDLAFESAATMPHRPHLKNRARLQARLAEAAIDAGLPQLAESYAPRIHNWRGALVEGRVAAYHASRGDEENARRVLDAAIKSEDGIDREEELGWRRDRVRASIAETLALLGDESTAAQIQAGLTPVEAGRLATIAVRSVTDEQAEGRMDVLEKIAVDGELEQGKFALLAIAEFYDRFHGDESKRADVEARIRRSWGTLPIDVRVELLEELALVDIAHGDSASAREIAGEIPAMLEGVHWQPQDEVALRARVAKLLARAGDTDAARKSADDALARFEESAASVHSIFQGDAIVPLAEAYLVIGDDETARAMYERALEVAMVNPNGRPQLEDFVDIVCSMSRMRHTPSEPLAERMREVIGEISAPW